LRFSLDVPVEKRSIHRSDITIDLEFPPSVNNLFVNGSKGRFTSPAYKDWQTRAGWEIIANRPGRVPGPVKVSFIFEDKAGRRDLDNLQKAPLDLLVKHKVIDGDHRSIVREINAKWGGVKGVRIIIQSLSQVERAA
jgi:crossover junction endodeoxyribonuclease RusA